MHIDKTSISIFDAKQLREPIKGSAFEHKQIEAGNFEAELFRLDMGSSTLERGTFNRSLFGEGKLSDTHIFIGSILKSPDIIIANSNSYIPGDLLILDEGSELTYKLPSNSTWSAFSIPREHLYSLRVSDLDMKEVGKKLTPLSRKKFIDQLNYLFNMLNVFHGSLTKKIDIKMLYRHLSQLYATTITQFNNVEVIQKSLQKEFAKKIQQFIYEHADEPIQMSQLSELIGKSERSVERIFNNVLGISPYTYLKLHRLHLVRKILLNSNPKTINITNIALENGFFHIGHFGKEYKKQFNETPSQTLKRI